MWQQPMLLSHKTGERATRTFVSVALAAEMIGKKCLATNSLLAKNVDAS